MNPKWTNIDVGPRKIKPLEQAIKDLRWESNTYTERTGVVGGESSDSTLTDVFGDGTRNPRAIELGAELHARFGGTITSATFDTILAAFQGALVDAIKARPVEDKRRAPAEVAQIHAKIATDTATAHERAERSRASIDAVRATMPVRARAVILAELHVDECDSMADYHGRRTIRRVAIGWRMTDREDFRALHKAAATFLETAHLGPGLGEWTASVVLAADFPSSGAGIHRHAGERSTWHDELTGPDGKRTFTTRAEADAFVAVQPAPHPVRDSGVLVPFRWNVAETSDFEHRENYSMGGGNYLKRGGRYADGWAVVSRAIDSLAGYVIELGPALVAPKAPTPPAPTAPTSSDEIRAEIARLREENARLRLVRLRKDPTDWTRCDHCGVEVRTPGALDRAGFWSLGMEALAEHGATCSWAEKFRHVPVGGAS